MADKAIAIVVAGSGETSSKEVFDLIEDYTADYDDVALVVPVSKSLFTESVQNAVEWYGDDDGVMTVQVEGEALSRKSSALGSGDAEKVESFADVFADPFEGFDKVEFFVALPSAESDDYDDHLAWIEAALEAKIPVKNLCAGLDDVVMAEEEPEPEPAPEPEPEKPTRRRRGAPKDEEPDPEKPARRSRAKKAEEPEKDLQQEVAEARTDTPPRTAPPEDVAEALVAVSDAWAALLAWEHAASLISGQEVKHGLVGRLERAFNVLAETVNNSLPLAGENAAKPEPAETEPKRGRGRPRTNFEVKEIWDDEEEAWVERPRGRMAKGTKWRVRHSETDEVLDEGVA